MNKELKKLITAANRASDKTRFGHYPMAPSVGLSDREIARHRPALVAHGVAARALEAAGFKAEATEHLRAVQEHSWVIHRRGAF